MRRKLKWRIISDYIGAGSYVLEPARAIVGTKQGVQCVTREVRRRVLWTVDLGSRCLGVSKAEGNRYLATCRRGIFLLSNEGKIEKRRLFAGYLGHEAVRTGEGLLVTESLSVQLLTDWENEPAWTFRLRSALGRNLKRARPVDVFESGDCIVGGYVDQEAGVGRVVVLDKKNGKLKWSSEPGPLSEVFDAGDGVFAWCLAGSGAFESRMTRLDGTELCRCEAAGLGARKESGRIALLVGSNESPVWENWQCATMGSDGQLQVLAKVRGRAPVRPTCHSDGSIYFISYVFHLDPMGSRAEHPNVFLSPHEALYQHLVGANPQIPEYEVYLQKLSPGQDKAEILHHISGSFSLARPAIHGGEVVFCDGADLIAVDR